MGAESRWFIVDHQHKNFVIVIKQQIFILGALLATIRKELAKQTILLTTSLRLRCTKL